MINSSRQYQPRISTLMNLFEINYMLMTKMLSGEEEIGASLEFFISDFLSYSITVDEVTRYTSVVTIKQNFLHQKVNNKICNRIAILFQPKMSIRLYHDARTAEVVSFQDMRFIKARYNYPNADMHLPDEKQQISQFLKEWLQLCQQLGQVKINSIN